MLLIGRITMQIEIHLMDNTIFNIAIKEDGYADANYQNDYRIDQFNFKAYNDYTIRIPRKLIEIRHSIINETVHFSTDNMIVEGFSYNK